LSTLPSWTIAIARPGTRWLATICWAIASNMATSKSGGSGGAAGLTRAGTGGACCGVLVATCTGCVAGPRKEASTSDESACAVSLHGSVVCAAEPSVSVSRNASAPRRPPMRGSRFASSFIGRRACVCSGSPDHSAGFQGYASKHVQLPDFVGFVSPVHVLGRGPLQRSGDRPERLQERLCPDRRAAAAPFRTDPEPGRDRQGLPDPRAGNPGSGDAGARGGGV